ncbi:MAG: 50S ribosomal protein L29 [Gemmatimonadota bacterium]
MKAMKAGDLMELSVEELNDKLAELSEEQFKLRFRSATESIENPIQFRNRRRDIARIKTVLKAKQQES